MASTRGSVRRSGYGLGNQKVSFEQGMNPHHLRDLELLVDVAKDDIERIPNLVQVGRREQVIQRKILHQRVVLLDWQARISPLKRQGLIDNSH